MGTGIHVHVTYRSASKCPFLDINGVVITQHLYVVFGTERCETVIVSWSFFEFRVAIFPHPPQIDSIFWDACICIRGGYYKCYIKFTLESNFPKPRIIGAGHAVGFCLAVMLQSSWIRGHSAIYFTYACSTCFGSSVMLLSPCA